MILRVDLDIDCFYVTLATKGSPPSNCRGVALIKSMRRHNTTLISFSVRVALVMILDADNEKIYEDHVIILLHLVSEAKVPTD